MTAMIDALEAMLAWIDAATVACERAMDELGGNGRARGGVRNECGGAAPKLSTNRPVAPAAEGGLCV